MPIFGVDVRAVGVGDTVVVDGSASAFPYATLADLPPGDYLAQAVLDLSQNHRSHGAPGNLYSQARPFSVGSAPGGAVSLRLTERVRAERAPDETAHVRFVRLRSARLSRFHGRPFDLWAGVILPRGYEDDPARRYPVRVRIGGYGDRYTEVVRLMRPGSAFREAWLADDVPRMILVHLNGAGPYGDPYQVNSANNGPYGDAITMELIPLIEARFRAVGQPAARVIDGGSTGGWVALALQIFYPDFFNGAWSSCPDRLDFRRLQLVNIYEDANAMSMRSDASGPPPATPAATSASRCGKSSGWSPPSGEATAGRGRPVSGAPGTRSTDRAVTTGSRCRSGTRSQATSIAL